MTKTDLKKENKYLRGKLKEIDKHLQNAYSHCTECGDEGLKEIDKILHSQERINLDKSKKYIIMGVAHSGTCSVEKYMVSLGYDVVRAETALRSRHTKDYAELWGHMRAIFVIADKTDPEDIEYIKTYWEGINPVILHLNDLKEDPNFPWENKGNIFTSRPDYHKFGDGFSD